MKGFSLGSKLAVGLVVTGVVAPPVVGFAAEGREGPGTSLRQARSKKRKAKTSDAARTPRANDTSRPTRGSASSGSLLDAPAPESTDVARAETTASAAAPASNVSDDLALTPLVATRAPIVLEGRATVGVPDLAGLAVTVLPWRFVSAEVGASPIIGSLYARAGVFHVLSDDRGADGEGLLFRVGAQVGIRSVKEQGTGFNAVGELAGTYWFANNLGATAQLTAGAVHVGGDWTLMDMRVASPWYPDVRLAGGISMAL